MGRHELAVDGVVNASASTVWKILTDPSGYPQWMSHVKDATRHDAGPLRVGSRFRLTTQLGTHVLASEVEIETLRPDRHVAWAHRSDELDGEAFAMISDGRTEFELDDDGKTTKVRFRMSFTANGLKAKLGAGYFLSHRVRPRAEESLERLKQLCGSFR